MKKKMTIKKEKILLAFLLIFLLAETTWAADQTTKNGDFWTGTCSCQCKGVELDASAVSISSSENAKSLCHEECARSCGGYTTCSSDDSTVCTSCCKNTFCASSYSDSISSMPDKCQLSCSSTCSYKGLVNDVVTVIYEVAGILGALLIVINGARMVTSQDPEDRNAAKNGIIYVIIALIIIIMAASLVNFFMNSATTPLT